MNAPASIWLDERVARTLPRVKDEELAERGVAQVRYFSEEEVAGMVRRAGPPDEMIVQITGAPGVVYGLSNLGNVYALGSDGWEQVADSEFKP